MTLKLRPAQWGSAIALSAAVHLGLAASYWGDTEEPLEIANGGGSGLEIGLVLGEPDGEALVAQSDQPAAPPQPTAPQPQPVLAPEPKPDPVPEPEAEVEPEPELETVDAPTATENLVAVADEPEDTSAQPLAPPAQTEPQPQTQTQQASATSTGPAGGIGGDGSNNRAKGYVNGHPGGGKARNAREYFGELMAWLNQHKRYPVELKQKKQEGIVEVEFTVDRSGQVTEMTIAKSCGHDLLDQAALQMLADATPLPPIPNFIDEDSLTLVIPVEYSLITNALN